MSDSVEQQSAAIMDHIMTKAQPHLERLSFLFGKQAKLTLLVQADGQPGCLILSPHGTEIASLQKALRETAEMEKLVGVPISESNDAKN